MPFKDVIDSHAHLTSEGYSDEAIHLMLQRSEAAHVKAIINICTDQASLSSALKSPYPSVFSAAAIPPHDVHQSGLESYFEAIEAALQAGRLIAVGEAGLDCVNAEGALEQQIVWLKRHMALAKKYEKPLILHCREAFEALFALFDEEHYSGPTLFHCFTGTLVEAEEAVRRGFYLSMSGILTFKKSEALREVAKAMPLNRLMIETDCPWLSPQSKRGQVNEPAFVQEVADVLETIRQEEVRGQLFQNTKDFFGLCL